MGIVNHLIFLLAVFGASYIIWNHFAVPRIISVYDKANIKVQGNLFFDKTTNKELTNSEVQARIKKLYHG